MVDLFVLVVDGYIEDIFGFVVCLEVYVMIKVIVCVGVCDVQYFFCGGYVISYVFVYGEFVYIQNLLI